MASDVVTYSGVSNVPTQFANQRNIDTCANGVKWLALMDDAAESGDDARLRFLYSVDGGATWQEDTSQDINDVKVTAGIDMEIAWRSDGEERMVVGYVRHDVLHIAFGKFRSNRQSFYWLREGVHASSYHGSWRYPSVRCIPLQSNWWVHPSWVKLSSGRSYVYLQIIKFYGWDSYSKNYERYTHSIPSSGYSRPCWGHRHLGNKHKVNSGQPDLYLVWFTGTPGDNSSYRRCYKRRYSYSGSSWREETLRTIKEETVNAGLIDSAFTGRVYASVISPSDDAANIELHLMNPSDTERLTIDVPGMNKGTLRNLALTWDDFTGDIWIVASGNDDNKPYYIIYEWATKTFSSWSLINNDALLPNSLDVKKGSSFNEIECVYVVNSGGNSLVRWELIGLTNLPPTQPPFLTESGPRNINEQFVVAWVHTDLDGDPQVAYSMRRTNDAGDGYEHWNGSNWQTNWTSVTSSVQEVTFGTGWIGDAVTKEYQVQTYDGQEWSEWNDPIVITGSVPVNPSIVSPNNDVTDPFTIISPQFTITWNVEEQLAYRIRLSTPAGAVVYSTGWVPDEFSRELEVPFLLTNLSNYTIELTTQNNEGLESTPDTVNIDALFDPPPLPVFTIVPVLESRSFLIQITNPDPVGNEPETDHNNIYVQIDNSGEWKRIATAIEPDTFARYYPAHGLDTEFMVESVSADGAINQAT